MRGPDEVRASARDAMRDPSPTDLQVLRLPREAAPAAGLLLARAFRDDPIQVAMLPDEAKRALLSPEMFAAEIRSTMAAGGHLTGTSDGGGVALWTPPGVTVGARHKLSGGPAMPRLLVRMPPSTVRVGFHLMRELPRRRSALVPEPHWYLAVLGVAPARQRRGLGALLVRRGLDLADQDGTRAYLETETEPNVHFYEGLGFTVLERITIRGLGLPMWLMARDPQPPG